MTDQPTYQMPRIAIAMTTFNGERFVAEQLKSILAQSLPPYEIVICDDCSTDRTFDIVSEFASRDSRIICLRNEKQLGVVQNFKKAVSLVSAAGYIALADQDDKWLPDKLSTLYHSMTAIEETTSPCMVYSDLAVIDDKGRELNPSFWNELGQDGYRHCFQTLLYGNFVTGCTMLINDTARLYFLEMPPDVAMHDAWMALVCFGLGRADAVSRALVMYRKHADNAAFTSEPGTVARRSRWRYHLAKLFTDRNFLNEQIRLVRLFNSHYGTSLDEAQHREIARLLSLERKSYLKKQFVFQSVFRNYRK